MAQSNALQTRVPSARTLIDSKNSIRVAYTAKKYRTMIINSTCQNVAMNELCKRMLVQSIEQVKPTDDKYLISLATEKKDIKKIQLWLFGQTYMKVNMPIVET